MVSEGHLGAEEIRLYQACVVRQITMSVKFPCPEKLNEIETAPSLEQWKTSFITFAQRDPALAPFLTAKWDTTKDHRGFHTIPGGLTAAEQATNCEMFLRHLVSYLKKPYWNIRIIERSTSLKSVWKTFDEIFDIEHNADSLLDIASMKMSTSESYSSFLARILFHLENHMPGAGITVDNVASGNGESMSIMVMDLAVKDWLEKIHPSLIERVKIEYGVQIKEGVRLSKLAPQIAKAIPSMLKKINNTKAEVVRVLQEYGHATDEDNTQINYLQSRRGNQRSRGSGRPTTRGRGATNNFGARPKFNQKSICKHCKWLADHWDIKEIDYNHESKSCRRTMPSEVKMMLESHEEEQNPFEESGEDAEDAMDDEDGKCQYKMVVSTNSLLFQKAEDPAQEKDVDDVMSPVQCDSAMLPSSDSHLPRVSDTNLSGTDSTPLRVITQRTSPRIRVTFRNKEAVMTVDEGSELNAVSETFAKDNNIQMCPSSRKASGAGGNRLEIVGESLDEIYLDTKFQSRRFSLNLGRVAIIRNLSCPIIMGEPGKCENNITTDPKKREIIMRKEGEDLMKGYYEPNSTFNHLCRIEGDKMTVFPGDSIKLKIPTFLKDSTISVAPRKEFPHLFKARCLEVNDVITVVNESPFPINIKKDAHVADMRLATENVPQELKFQEEKLRLVHQHSEDDFKYLPTVKKVVPPDPSSISTVSKDSPNVSRGTITISDPEDSILPVDNSNPQTMSQSLREMELVRDIGFERDSSIQIEDVRTAGETTLDDFAEDAAANPQHHPQGDGVQGNGGVHPAPGNGQGHDDQGARGNGGEGDPGAQGNGGDEEGERGVTRG